MMDRDATAECVNESEPDVDGEPLGELDTVDDRDADGDESDERDTASVREPRAVTDGDCETDAEPECEREKVGEREGEPDRVAVAQRESAGETEGDGLSVRLARGETESVPDGEGDPLSDGDGLALVDRVPRIVTEAVVDKVGVCEGDVVCEREAVAQNVALPLCENVGRTLHDAEPESVGSTVGKFVGGALALVQGDMVREGDAEPELDGDADADPDAESEPVTVCDRDARPLTEPLGEPLGVAVTVELSERRALGDDERDLAALPEDDTDAHSVGDLVTEPVPDPDRDGVADVRGDAERGGVADEQREARLEMVIFATVIVPEEE